MCLMCTDNIVKFQNVVSKVLFVILIVICLVARASEIVQLSAENRQGTYALGSCKIVIDQPCPDPDVTFYLYTRNNPEDPQPIKIGHSMDESNITKSYFDYRLPTKIIIHGYNSDMFLNVLVEIKKQYLRCNPHNVFAVDWANLAPGPCYPTAVYNTRHVGKCAAQLVERIKELGSVDIHVVGFSLGAHVTNYMALHLHPYKLPRISGLDPAMPGFAFVNNDHKLDASDAEFVDVFHTNAFIQGTMQTSGHVDFYMNGGVIQPGCWAESRFFACNHHRAPLYFAESITTSVGFWAWPCRNYFMYLIGQCPPIEPQILAGEFVNKSARGMHLVITGSVSPFAVGKFIGPAVEILKQDDKNNKKILQAIKNIETYKNELSDCEDAQNFIDVFTPETDYHSHIEINKV